MSAGHSAWSQSTYISHTVPYGITSRVTAHHNRHLDIGSGYDTITVFIHPGRGPTITFTARRDLSRSDDPVPAMPSCSSTKDAASYGLAICDWLDRMGYTYPDNVRDYLTAAAFVAAL